MIGLGAQYLTAAGFGRYRITAASLGKLDLLGTYDWLTVATKQAILGAFGDDGKAVIKATNAYLNGIAAQGQAGKDKATALAGFINEDPMMVCSLGLEPQGVTMPIRWLKGDRLSYVKTGYYANLNSEFRTRFKDIDYPSHNYGTNADSSKSVTFYRGSASNNHSQRFGNQEPTMSATNFNGCKTSKQNKDGIWLNDTKVVNYSSQSDFTTPQEIYVFTASGANGVPNSNMTGGALEHFDILESGVQVQNLVPFVSQTRNGMVDLVAGVFHPNQGTGHFTDAYTLQDGVTPWTPSTP